jgi:flagellar L-ring protein precursor FlgH
MRTLPLLALLLCAGCTSMQDFGREPAMSPVGAGIYAYRAPLPADAFPATGHRSYRSLWNDTRADLFQDPRATKVGDIVTVKIRINDKATLDNSSARSRGSNTGLTGGYDYSLHNLRDPDRAGEGEGSLSLGAKSSANGSGTIDRSEKIDLSVAAVVTEVLPNGNLLISGSQEVRVNFELRILNVTGIVRPRDISTANTIDYEKIAEARVSYGGRGRISEVQQPRWGQQALDAVAPF